MIFTTREQADLSASHMVRRTDNSVKPFNRDHLFISLYQSCRHRDTALEDAEALTATVITKLLRATATEPGAFTTATLKQESSKALERFDSIAATYYGAYYA